MPDVLRIAGVVEMASWRWSRDRFWVVTSRWNEQRQDDKNATKVIQEIRKRRMSKRQSHASSSDLFNRKLVHFWILLRLPQETLNRVKKFPHGLADGSHVTNSTKHTLT
jgi:hypothetical protein